MDTNALVSIFAFTVLTLLWLIFAYALLMNRAMLEQMWQTFRGWPLVVKIVVGLLALPVVLGLWVWNTKWPGWARLVVVVALAWVTVYTFFPAAVTAVQAAW